MEKNRINKYISQKIDFDDLTKFLLLKINYV